MNDKDSGFNENASVFVKMHTQRNVRGRPYNNWYTNIVTTYNSYFMSLNLLQ